MKKRIVKLAAIAGIFFICMSGWSAEATQKNTDPSGSSEITLTTDQSQVPISAIQNDNQADSKQPSTLWLFIRMIFVLAVVIACIYGIVYIMRRGMKPGADTDPFLRKVSQITLSPGKSVQIVTLLDHAYIIGVTDNAVSLIGQVDDKELVDSMNLYADKTSGSKKARSFADVLDLFMPNGPHGSVKSVFGESAKNATEVLKKQRDRLNGDQT